MLGGGEVSYNSVPAAAIMNGPPPSERRRAVRAKVRWPAVLFRDDEAIETVTKDLSSCGFYCVSPKRLSVGESLFCKLMIPVRGSTAQKPSTAIECRIRVVRVEDAGGGNFGIGCQIEEYTISGMKAVVSAHS